MRCIKKYFRWIIYFYNYPGNLPQLVTRGILRKLALWKRNFRQVLAISRTTFSPPKCVRLMTHTYTDDSQFLLTRIYAILVQDILHTSYVTKPSPYLSRKRLLFLRAVHLSATGVNELVIGF